MSFALSRNRGSLEIKSADDSIDDDDEIKSAIVDLSKTTTDALKKIQDELKQHGAAIDEFEMKSQLRALGGGGGDTKFNADGLKAEYKALSGWARSSGTGDISELKSLDAGSGPDGGYLVLPQRSNVMSQRLFDLSPMRRLARVQPMDSGDTFEEPFDIEEAEAVWVGELESRGETGSPRLGLLSIPLCEMYAAPKASQKLLDTSYIDIGAWLSGKIDDRFGRSEGIAFVSGDGLKRPRGLLTYTTSLLVDADRSWGQIQYVKTGDANGFVAADPDTQTMPGDVLKSLAWSLRAPYRKGASFLLNSQTASVIDKFKDAQGNYIWTTGMTSGAQSSLLGYPVEIDENMDDIGANKYPIAFGNFKLGYTIVERPGLKLLRDPYDDKPNVIFYAYRRVGGGVSNFDAIKLLKCAA